MILLQHLNAQHTALIAFDAGPVVSKHWRHPLSAIGLCAIIVNPSNVPSYANAIGCRAKTDEIDAQVIAAFVLAT